MFLRLFKDKNFLKMLILLAVPIALQNLLNALLNIIDSFMVSALGDVSMSAVLLCNQYIFIYQLVIFAIAGTSTIFIAQFFGAKKYEDMSQSTGLAMIFTFSLTILFVIATLIFPTQIISLFGSTPEVIAESEGFLRVVALSCLPFCISTVFYTVLRGIKKVQISIWGSLLGIGLNCFFNYVLMFGKLGFPELGLLGAGIGTLISRSIEMVFVIIYVSVAKFGDITNVRKMFRIRGEFAIRYIKIMIPTVLNELFWALGTTCYLAVFARLPNSNMVLSAINITQSIDKLLFVVLIGMGNSVGVIIGNSIGSESYDKTKDKAYKSMAFAMVVGVLVGVLMLGVSFVVPYLFSNVSMESLQLAQRVMWVFAIFMVTRALNFTMVVGIGRSGGDAKFVILLETISVWVLAVPSVALGGLVFSLDIAWLYVIVFAEELVKMCILIPRIISGKWCHNVTISKMEKINPIDSTQIEKLESIESLENK